MRIHFRNTDLPKKAAKRILTHFKSDIPEAPFKLSNAQEVAAKMLGYDSWHNLISITKLQNVPPSVLDENCTNTSLINRIQFQADMLSDLVPSDIDRIDLAMKFRVSARNPSSQNVTNSVSISTAINSILFAARSFDQNKILYWERENQECSEWLFQASSRSLVTGSTIMDNQILFPDDIQGAHECMDWLEGQLLRQPEDVFAMEEYLRLSLLFSYFDRVSEYLDGFARILQRIIPPSFNNRKMDYAELRNRPFIRTVFWLASCYYYLGSYERAKRWFQISTTITDVFT